MPGTEGEVIVLDESGRSLRFLSTTGDADALVAAMRVETGLDVSYPGEIPDGLVLVHGSVTIDPRDGSFREPGQSPLYWDREEREPVEVAVELTERGPGLAVFEPNFAEPVATLEDGATVFAESKTYPDIGTMTLYFAVPVEAGGASHSLVIEAAPNAGISEREAIAMLESLPGG